MIIQCAWCKKVIGEKAPLNDPMVSHTICRDCSIKHFGIDPEEGKSNPAINLNKVDLPLPDLPSTAMICPWWEPVIIVFLISKLKSFKTNLPLKDLLTLSAQINVSPSKYIY